MLSRSFTPKLTVDLFDILFCRVFCMYRKIFRRNWNARTHAEYNACRVYVHIATTVFFTAENQQKREKRKTRNLQTHTHTRASAHRETLFECTKYIYFDWRASVWTKNFNEIYFVCLRGTITASTRIWAATRKHTDFVFFYRFNLFN